MEPEPCKNLLNGLLDAPVSAYGSKQPSRKNSAMSTAPNDLERYSVTATASKDANEAELADAGLVLSAKRIQALKKLDPLECRFSTTTSDQQAGLRQRRVPQKEESKPKSTGMPAPVVPVAKLSVQGTEIQCIGGHFENFRGTEAQFSKQRMMSNLSVYETPRTSNVHAAGALAKSSGRPSARLSVNTAYTAKTRTLSIQRRVTQVQVTSWLDKPALEKTIDIVWLMVGLLILSMACAFLKEDYDSESYFPVKLGFRFFSPKEEPLDWLC